MIYIISEKNDITTDYVAEWLTAFSEKFVRSNYENVSQLNSLSFSNNSFDINLNNLKTNEIKKIWHRRAYDSFTLKKLRKSVYYTYLKREEEGIVKPIESILKSKVDYIGSYVYENENYKINHLLLAKSVGMLIPNTLITTSKEALLNFYYQNNKSIITKDIRYSIRIDDAESKLVSGGTCLVSLKMIRKMENDFSLSLFQNRIEKAYEARIFFFNERLYCMAILSQNDDQTSLDYRNYNREKPNRCIPLLLPDQIKTRVLKFIRKSNLRTGSIDIIIDKNNQYFFLEVNPQGQLDWLSQNCNYYIEKHIAEYLSDRHEKNKRFNKSTTYNISE